VATGRHRRDGGDGYDPKGSRHPGRSGVPDGNENVTRKDDPNEQAENRFDQAEADRRGQAYRDRHNK
jgi:hypothetical protein